MNYTILVHVLADGDGERERDLYMYGLGWMLGCSMMTCAGRDALWGDPKFSLPFARCGQPCDPTTPWCACSTWLLCHLVWYLGSPEFSPPNVSRWGLCKTRTRKDEMYWNVHLLPSDMSPLFGLPSSSIFWAFEVWHWFHAERTCWSNNAPVAHVLICSTINGSEFIYQVQVRFLFWVRAINMCIYIYPNHFKYLQMGVS